MKKLRHREVKQFAQDYTVKNWQGQDMALSRLIPESVLLTTLLYLLSMDTLLRLREMILIIPCIYPV